MPAQLISLSDGPNILLDKPILLIGRHHECDIQIDSRKISRRHCCIAQVNDYLVVRDLGSTNGIRVNGTRVQEGRLNDNDELTIGANRYRVSWDMLGEEDEERENDQRGRLDAEKAGQPMDEEGDEVLECCDEPVPLHTPQGQLAAPAPAPPAALRRVEEMIVPDELNLAPSSDQGVKPLEKTDSKPPPSVP
jgi:pSer/pThr/pTyr-binding forkhead associated (FHA) protein